MSGKKRNNIDPPCNTSLAGKVAFNHTSGDGRYVIGVGAKSFETKWAAASPNAAHLMNDPSSIRGVAIAEQLSSIRRATRFDAEAADFTSRVRTVMEGQIAILENFAGYFAFLRIDYVNRSQVPSENMLEFEYVIRDDWGANSKFVVGDDPESRWKSEITSVSTEALSALTAVEGDPNPDASSKFGHNQPPSEYALSEAELLETIQAVSVVTSEVQSDIPDPSAIRKAIDTIARSVRSIANWMAAKMDAAIEEFAKTLGKAAAVASVGLFVSWVAVHDKLSTLIQYLAGFGG